MQTGFGWRRVANYPFQNEVHQAQFEEGRAMALHCGARTRRGGTCRHAPLVGHSRCLRHAGWPDLCGTLVLASRIPVALAAALGLWSAMGSAADLVSIAPPAALLVCNVLWAKADLLLFRSTNGEVVDLSSNGQSE